MHSEIGERRKGAILFLCVPSFLSLPTISGLASVYMECFGTGPGVYTGPFWNWFGMDPNGHWTCFLQVQFWVCLDPFRPVQECSHVNWKPIQPVPYKHCLNFTKTITFSCEAMHPIEWCFFFSLELHSEWEDKENVVEFDFLGKDSVRYWNWVPVEKKVRELRSFLCFALRIPTAHDFLRH